MQTKDRKTAEGILFTDMYELTMAQLYYRMGLHEKIVQFDHFFRSNPDYGTHQAGYCVNAGLEWLLDWMRESHFRDEDIDALRSQVGSTGSRVFQEDFLNWLQKNGVFSQINMWAIPEGRVVHPNVPLTIIQGPLAVAQLLETALLNQLNYQTLIATKAARMRESGQGKLMMEFGLRRGPDKGANAGARAALIGGADFTSNVGISQVLGFPPKGTHAHSMVQVFMALGEGELNAFRAYADLYPDDCLLLVDTINTLESGIPNAIKVFEELKRKGHKPVGIRLDSGDLAYLSIRSAKLLDRAGFPDTSIVLSNQLDELVIWQIVTQIKQEAPYYNMDPDKIIDRLVYGVGTRLITSQGHTALDGVYKLVAVQDGGNWIPAIKISEVSEKIPTPGQKRVWRIYDRRGRATCDLISQEEEKPQHMEQIQLHHVSAHTAYRTLSSEKISSIEPLMVRVLNDGKLVYDMPTIEEIRKKRIDDIEKLDPGVRRIMNPHIYHVSLTKEMWNLKQKLIKTV